VNSRCNFAVHCFAECHNGDIIDVNRNDSNTSAINLSVVAKDTMNTDHANEHSGQNTYRCYSSSFLDATLPLEPFTSRSTISSGSTARVERRCKIGNVSIDGNEANIGQNEKIKRDKYVRFSFHHTIFIFI